MMGKVRVVSEREYAEWLQKEAGPPEGMSLEELGERLYTSRRCVTCHSIDGSANVGPTFLGVFGHKVTLKDGQQAMADENYIRESILHPEAKVVAGFEPVMPTYQGLVNDREIDALIAFIKSRGDQRKQP
jgi:cytochrome c oxidase subunit 2